ncbi:hypothetical protein [Oceanobacillus sp. CF4.6]|uniref:hypothetical protein n=1 Tax=Oceanobacillus sp. CF4.6 TaxID=3373080 RepID=UPI003EE47C8E
MKKVAIIGCSGSGKSTLARTLGAMLHLPVYHLDALFWQPGWVPTNKEHFVTNSKRSCKMMHGLSMEIMVVRWMRDYHKRISLSFSILKRFAVCMASPNDAYNTITKPDLIWEMTAQKSLIGNFLIGLETSTEQKCLQ